MLLTHEEVMLIEQLLVTSTSSSVTDSFILKVEYTKIAEVIQKVEKLVEKTQLSRMSSLSSELISIVKIIMTAKSRRGMEKRR
jgi:hypothetical protein